MKPTEQDQRENVDWVPGCETASREMGKVLLFIVAIFAVVVFAQHY